MRDQTFDTISEAMNKLTKEGYKENFVTRENKILGLYSKKSYDSHELLITESFRFEGMTNPADSTELFALEASDGTKGTLSINYGANNNHDAELIRKLEMKAHQ